VEIKTNDCQRKKTLSTNFVVKFYNLSFIILLLSFKMSVLFKKCLVKYSHLRPAIKLNCHRASSNFKGITVDSVKAEFHHYEGGSVKLVKNEESGIATISLCHPEKRNAISGRMMCQLSDIVSELENWSDKGRAVLLKSDDEDYFCSGADLTSTVVHISRSFKMINSFHDIHRCPGGVELRFLP
jgi:hypothetical protein